MTKADHHFEPFNIPKNLIRALEATPHYPLAVDLGELHPDGKGVYALYLTDMDAPVYVGKTDASGNVRKRLRDHAKKIDGREGIKVGSVRFRYLVMEENWLARACEEFMIEHYRPAWQGSGFGSHIPGKGRPGLKGPDKFTKQYPLKKGKA